MERVNENERFVVKNGIKWLYMCDYDWSSGSFVFKQKQSHFHPNRSINLWKKTRNIWLESRNIVLLVYIQIWTSNDVWWGNMQVSHTLIRVLAIFTKFINKQPMGCNCSTYFKNGFLAPFFCQHFISSDIPSSNVDLKQTMS